MADGDNSRGPVEQTSGAEAEPGTGAIPAWTPWRHPLFWVILLGALVLRLGFVRFVTHPELVRGQFEFYGDEYSYHCVAATLAATGRYAEEPGDPLTAYRTPGFVLPLAGLYGLFGPLPAVGILWSVVCGVGLVVAMGWAGFALFGNHRAALGAMALSAILPSFVAYSALIMTDCLATLGAVVGMGALVNWERERRWQTIAGAGLWMGWSYLARPSSGLMLPLVLLWIWSARPYWCALWHSAAFGAAVAAWVVPWTLRNYLALGVLLPGTTAAGAMLWVSNNPLTAGLVQPVLPPELEGLQVPRDYFLGGWANREYLPPGMATIPRGLSEWDQHKYYSREAVQFVRGHPVAVLRMDAYKVWRLIKGDEPVQPRKMGQTGARKGLNLRAMVGPLERWLVLALGLVGLGRLLNRRRLFYLVGAFLLSAVVLVLIAYPSARFFMVGTSVLVLSANGLLARGSPGGSDQ